MQRAAVKTVSATVRCGRRGGSPRTPTVMEKGTEQFPPADASGAGGGQTTVGRAPGSYVVAGGGTIPGVTRTGGVGGVGGEGTTRVNMNRTARRSSSVPGGGDVDEMTTTTGTNDSNSGGGTRQPRVSALGAGAAEGAVAQRARPPGGLVSVAVAVAVAVAAVE